MSSSAFPLACIITPPPRTKFSLSTSTPKLTTKTTFYPFPCKLQTSHLYIPSNKSFFHRYAASQSSTDVLTSSNEAQTTLTDDQRAAEWETLLQQIRDLFVKTQQLSSVSEEEENGGKNALEGILKDFYSLSAKLLGLEPKDSIPTPSSIAETLLDLANKSLVSSATSDETGLVPILPNPDPGLISDEVDYFVQYGAKKYWGEVDTSSYYLSGNFAPIRKENPPTSDLQITGQIPESLNGMMLRNGPDPKFDPEVHYSWMDGDSMIHGIKFKNGTATYVSRYTVTSRFLQEEEFKRAELFKYGDLEGEYGGFAIQIQLLRSRLKILDMSYGYNMSNDSVVYHGGRIMALNDFGKPIAISVADDGNIQTLGINDYNGVLDHWLAPHPKKDPITGEMFSFGSMYTEPYCIYNVISKDGVMRDPVPITVSGPTYMHDLGLTENYVIFMDMSYVFDPKKMVENNEWIYSLDPTKNPRFGVLPRYASSEEEIKWFEFVGDPFFIYHVANAWEDENGNIVMYTAMLNPLIDEKTSLPYLAPAISRISRRQTFSHGLEVKLTLSQLYKVTLDMSTMEAKREKVIETFVDFPKINERYTGRATQYVYMSEVNQDSKLPSIRKYDLNATDGKIESSLIFGNGIYGSEVVFVPKSATPTSEDDGYLITFVHDENTSQSFVYVIDAKTMTITATIQMPNRVPYGFHAAYISQEELQAQITTS